MNILLFVKTIGKILQRYLQSSQTILIIVTKYIVSESIIKNNTHFRIKH